jgi:glutamate-1-semialdehyde 2,1-aminomutase
VTRASGAYVTDADGREFLDYHAAFGPLVLGHNHRAVNAAVRQALERVDLVGMGVTDLEVELAESLCGHIPCAEQVLFTNSGSEATYVALRLARAVTDRLRVVKFQGTYHGWHDSVALNVISPAERVGRPDPLSAGCVPAALDLTTVLPFNDIEALRRTFAHEGSDIAAVIIEVIPHNIGCVLPTKEFLDAARDLTARHGALLVFDEVVTGFRHAIGGYQSICGVTPDLATFAKAMANGFPIAALAGRADLMAELAPGRSVFYAGTYNGHPASVAAALATIGDLEDGSVHTRTAALATQAADGLQKIADGLGVEMTVARFGSVFVPYFLSGPIRTYTDLLRNDDASDVAFRRGMCEQGILMLPTALKRNHVSAAHTARDVDRTLETAERVLRRLHT